MKCPWLGSSLICVGLRCFMEVDVKNGDGIFQEVGVQLSSRQWFGNRGSVEWR